MNIDSVEKAEIFPLNPPAMVHTHLRRFPHYSVPNRQSR